MIYDRFDVVDVPFPFTDIPQSKLRKALVLTPKSMNEQNGVTTLMMITSRQNSSWLGDTELTRWEDAGLKKPCYVRFKFFTADNGFILNKVGNLSKSDIAQVKKILSQMIGL
jgi:mRNA interferase MazF